MGRVVVLRLGHRPKRDERVTTHIALTARAFGADEVLVAGADPGLEETVARLARNFGGTFAARTGVPWRRFLQTWQGQVVHLTMYGEPLEAALLRVDQARDLLVVVGGEKVPRFVFERADLNVAVGRQPHSEVAALAVFLDRLGLSPPPTGEVHIVPMRRGKLVVRGRALTEKQALQVLDDARVEPSLVRHARRVADVAAVIATACGADVGLVVAGALLHDVGGAKGPLNALLSARVLEEKGLDDLAEAVRRHVAGGILPEEALSLGLPPKDYMPRTLEERVVNVAHALVGGERVRSTDEAVQAAARRSEAAAERLRAWQGEIERAAGRTLDELLRPLRTG